MDKTQIDWVVRPLYPTPEMIMAGARTKYVAEDGFKNEVGDVALQVWLNMGNAAPTPAAIPGELQAQAGMGDELPPLPEQLDWVNVFDRDGHTDEAEASSNYYDTDQMEAYARAALAARQQGAAEEAKPVAYMHTLDLPPIKRLEWTAKAPDSEWSVIALYPHPAPATDCAALVEAVRNVIGNLVALAAYVRGYMPGEVCRGFAVEMNQQADMLRAALAGVQAIFKGNTNEQ
jgi:hypothetical protein